MKKSMYFNYVKGVELKEKADAIKKAGFDGTELFRFYDDREPLADQLKAAKGAGLATEAVHADFCFTNDVWSTEAKGEEWVSFLIRCAREQGALGIPTMVVHLSRSDNPPPFNDVGLCRFRLLCDKAKEYGVRIALENLRRTDYLEKALSQIPNAYFCFDCGHELLYDGGFGILEKYKDRLLCVHLHDNMGDKDSHLLPFDGAIDWERMGKRIGETRKNFSLAFEVFCSADKYKQFPKEAFARAQRVDSFVK